MNRDIFIAFAFVIPERVTRRRVPLPRAALPRRACEHGKGAAGARLRQPVGITNKLLFAVIGACAFLFSNVACANEWKEWSDEQAIVIFARAGAAYKAEDFNSAVNQYQSIVDGGKENGSLYYNLGNSYFRLGNLGKAILNYEKARQLIPRDSDLNYNYQYALSQVKDQVVQQSQNGLSRLWQGVIQSYTAGEIVFILFVLGCLLGFIHLLSLYLRWPSRTRQMVLCILAAGWFLYLGIFISKENYLKGLAVVVVSSEAKFEPRQDATTHFTLSPGTRVKLLKADDSWAKIERLDGKMGWLLVNSFELL